MMRYSMRLGVLALQRRVPGFIVALFVDVKLPPMKENHSRHRTITSMIKAREELTGG